MYYAQNNGVLRIQAEYAAIHISRESKTDQRCYFMVMVPFIPCG